MTQKIWSFMLIEAVSFTAASLVHSGLLISGYRHAQARTAEGVIAVILFAGLLISIARPDWTRPVGLAVQGFALLGTLVGLTTIAIGIGPRTPLDLAYHTAILIVLLWGLIFTTQAGSPAAGRRG